MAQESWLWLSPRGTTRWLSAYVDGTEVVKGIAGRYAPPAELRTQVVPEAPGAVVTQARHDVREFDLPLHAAAGDYYGLQTLLSDLAVDMDPVAGEGTLRHVAPDGTMSDLFCRCVGGTGIEGEGAMGPANHRTTLIFQAHDPYWYRQPIGHQFIVGAPSSWFPLLPLSLGSSSVLGDIEVENIGDVDAWPVWTVVGPGSEVELINNTTGETLSVVNELLNGDELVIDTRPGHATVTGPGETNWRRYLEAREMWSLRPGINELTLALNDATGSSYIVLSYRPRKLAP